MAEYDAGHAVLRIVPSFQGAEAIINAEAQRWGSSAGTLFGRTFQDRLRASMSDAHLGPTQQQTTQQGDAAGRSFADTFKARVTAALRSLPDVRIGAATSEAEQKLRDLHAQLTELSNARVGVDIDAATALARIDELQGQLRQLGADSPNVQVRVDTARAAAQLRSLREDIDTATRDRDITVTGRFNNTLRAQIDAALRDLPEIHVNADSSDAERKIGELRARLDTLRGRVGVDLDSTEAQAKIAEITAELRELSTKKASPEIRVDTARAIADLQVIKAEIDSVGKNGETITPKVDTSGAQGGLSGLLAAGVALGPALIPVAAAIAGAIGAIGPAALAAGAGLGGLVIGGAPILKAVTAGVALGNAQQAQQTPAAQAVARQAATAAAQQLQQAQSSLATTEQSVAFAAGQAAQAVDVARVAQQRAAQDDAQAVSDAQRALAQAVTNSRTQGAQAAQAVSDAQRSLGQTHQSVAFQAGQAAVSVADTRRALAQTQQSVSYQAGQAAVTVQDSRRALAQTQQSVAYQGAQTALTVRDSRANVGVATQQAQVNNAAALLTEQQAEQSLASAQQHAVDAQITLNEARVQAARDIVNVTNALADARLSQQQDVLNVEDAKRQLDLALANPLGNDESRQRARLNYEQAQQALTDQQTKTKQLAEDKKKADSQGVNGSDRVRLAQEQLNASILAVSNAEAAAAKALGDIQRTRIAGERQIALAQEAYGRALAAQQQQELAGAQQIRAAREAVARAVGAQAQQQVAGAQQIRAAQEALGKAELAQQQQELAGAQQIRAAQEALGKAQLAQQLQQVSGANAVRAAQEALANAQRKQSRDQVDQSRAVENAVRAQQQQQITGAQSIVSAHNAVATAQRAVTVAGNHAATATLAAQTAFESALSQLGPAGQAFAKYLVGVDNSFQDLQKRAGEALVTPLLAAKDSLKPFGAAFSTLVVDSAGAMGKVGANIERALGSKAWLDRIRHIDGFTPRFIAKLGTIFGNFTTGITDVVLAFAPLTDVLLGTNGKGPHDAGTGLIGLSKKFAEWAARLSESKGFQSFLKYVEDNAPTVLGVLKDIFEIAVKLLVALAPLGEAMLKGLKFILDHIATQNPDRILAIFTALGLGVAVIAAAVGAVPVALGAALVGSIALAGLIAKHFHAIVQFVENIPHQIATAFRALGPSLLLGLFDGFSTTSIKKFFEDIGHSIVHWFKDVLGIHSPSTVFAAIGSDLITGFLNGVTSVLKAVEVFFTKTLPNTATGLPDLFIKAFGKSNIAVTVGQWFTDAYDNVVRLVHTAEGFVTGLPGALQGFFGDSPIARTVGQWFLDAYHNVLGVVGSAEGFLTGLPTRLRDYFGASPIASTIGGWFDDARRWVSGSLAGIGADLKQWLTVSLPSGLKAFASDFATPINFVINTVLDNGLIKAFNFIGNAVGLAPLGNINPVAPGYATGGIYPGYTPGRDIGYIGVSGGEAVMRPEWTQAVGPDYVHAANTAAVQGGIGGVKEFLGGFAGGGIIGDIWGSIKRSASGLSGIVNGVIGGIQHAASGLGGLLGGLTDPGGLLKKLLGPVGSELTALGSGPLGKLLSAAGSKLVAGAQSTLLNALVGSLSGGASGNPVGGWGYPVLSHTLSQGFGGASLHPGVDFPVPVGTQVYAAHDGTVSRLGPAATSGGAGNYLQVAVSSGIRYAMEHLSSQDVLVGQRVKLGDKIAHSGNTGNSTGPHLHFEIDTGAALGNYGSSAGVIDPMRFLAGQGAGLGLSSGAGLAFHGSSGVAQWAPMISKVLGMIGLSPSLLGRVETQMQTESGGNPRAINLWDSNARAGTPSKGLMQVIDPTFARYRNPALSGNIYDPEANIYAGLNYAASAYGPGLGFLGQGHGYDSGGALPPGYTLAFNGTGKDETILTAESVEFIQKLLGPHGHGHDGRPGLTMPAHDNRYWQQPVRITNAHPQVTPLQHTLAHHAQHAATGRTGPQVQQNFYTQGFDEEYLARYSARRMGEVLA